MSCWPCPANGRKLAPFRPALPALGIADRIRRHTAAGRPVWLYGHNMGGGFAVAVQEQAAAGSPPPLRLMRPSPCTTIPNA